MDFTLESSESVWSLVLFIPFWVVEALGLLIFWAEDNNGRLSVVGTCDTLRLIAVRNEAEPFALFELFWLFERLTDDVEVVYVALASFTPKRYIWRVWFEGECPLTLLVLLELFDFNGSGVISLFELLRRC